MFYYFIMLSHYFIAFILSFKKCFDILAIFKKHFLYELSKYFQTLAIERYYILEQR